MTTEESRESQQAELALELGIETSSATYIARTLDLAPDSEFTAQLEVLAAAYELRAEDVEQISALYGRRATPEAAA